MSIFPTPDQWHSLENICRSFLMLHCRQMPWECKYLLIALLENMRNFTFGTCKFVNHLMVLLENMRNFTFGTCKFVNDTLREYEKLHIWHL